MGHAVCLQGLCHNKPVMPIFVHETFVIVPKNALSKKKEHGQMTGMLFKTTDAIVELPLQRTTAFAARSSSR